MCGSNIPYRRSGRKYSSDIRNISGYLVGAGTVLTTEQVDLAVKSGAKFIVSPGFDPEIVDYCLKKTFRYFLDVFPPQRLPRL